MADIDVLGFEEGRERVLEVLDGARHRPVLVGVYGWPNGGKSHLIHEVKGCLNDSGIETVCYGGASNEDVFNLIRDSPEAFKPVVLFHCEWERLLLPTGKIVSSHEDPGCLAEKILGRDLDLTVGIYNPETHRTLRGVYDIVVSNPDSSIRSFLKQ